MQRFGRVLKLKPGKEAEYEQWHKNVWPENLQALRDSGIVNFTIFRYDRWLFSYFELPDHLTLDDVAAVTSEVEKCEQWEELMHNYQEALPESQGINWWVPMQEIWHG